jgi:hypothetical protein
MKKYILLISILSGTLTTNGQVLNTITTTDWNAIKRSGFYQNFNKVNAPTSNTNAYWGINVSYIESDTAIYNGQIAFMVNHTPVAIPAVYIRSTDWKGAGIWAKLIHSKGNHAIDGKLTVKEVEVRINTGADFVFHSEYDLKPLSELETFVKENKHLPEIPSKKQMVENGLNINDMQIKLLQKIEELTLYVIEQDKRIRALENEK